MEPVERPSTFAVGIDLGKRVDPSAICVTELKNKRYIVRHIERLPLGMGYHLQAARVGELYLRLVARLTSEQETAAYRADLLTDPSMRPPDHSAHQRITLYADCSGVGVAGVDDFLRRHPDLQKAHIIGVMFGSGDHFKLKSDGLEASLGKAWLVSRLQALLAPPARIELPPGAEAEALIEELRNYEIRVSETDAKLTAGVFATGKHDDLATALGLSCLVDQAKQYQAGSFRYA